MTSSATHIRTSLPKITPSQAGILRLLYNYRFLSSNQIQAFLGHANKSKVKIWLKDLTDKGYVERRFSKALGENTKPAVYSCALGAIRHFTTTDYATDTVIKRLYQDRKRTSSFIASSLLTADIALQLRGITTATLRFDFATSSLYSHPDSRANFLTDAYLSPNAIIIKDDRGAYTPYLLEIIPYGLPVNRLYGKINDYLDLYFSGDWQNHMGLSFPKIFFACATTKQIQDGSRFALLQLQDVSDTDTEDLRLVFLFQSSLKQNGFADRIVVDQEKRPRE